MKISLVHNPTAGGGEDIDDVVSLLTDAGHKVRHRSSKDDWKALLQDPGDLVVAAGGDGTVRKVALAAADGGLPFAALPIGTANNIAKSLGLVGDATELIASWSTGDGMPFDIGEVEAPWGSKRFIEAVGGGVIAELIGRGKEINKELRLLGRETDRALHLLADVLGQAEPMPWRIRAGDEDLSGDYLAVEVLNTRFVGPNVPLAPDADPSDGLLDVVVVSEPDRQPILDYLDGRLRLASGTMPSLRSVRAAEVRVEAPAGVRLHVDDAPWPSDAVLADRTPLRLRSLAGAVRMLGQAPR